MGPGQKHLIGSLALWYDLGLLNLSVFIFTKFEINNGVRIM